MHDAIGVHAADCRCDFVKNIAGLFLRQVMFVHDDIEQLLALTELGYDVDELCFLVDLVYFENGGVVLHGTTCTNAFSSAISFNVMVLIRGNFSALIFLIARMFPVCSWVTLKT